DEAEAPSLWGGANAAAGSELGVRTRATSVFGGAYRLLAGRFMTFTSKTRRLAWRIGPSPGKWGDGGSTSSVPCRQPAVTPGPSLLQTRGAGCSLTTARNFLQRSGRRSAAQGHSVNDLVTTLAPPTRTP